MTSSRAVVAAIVVLVIVAGADAVRNGWSADGDEPVASRPGGFLVDLDSSRESAPLPKARLLQAFPGRHPRDAAVSRVAVAPDGLVAVALSHVPGGGRRSRAAIELWRDQELVRAFAVPVGSFSLGLWFTAGGNAIATIGWDERAHVYDRDGRLLGDDAYFAYETR